MPFERDSRDRSIDVWLGYNKVIYRPDYVHISNCMGADGKILYCIHRNSCKSYALYSIALKFCIHVLKKWLNELFIELFNAGQCYHGVINKILNIQKQYFYSPLFHYNLLRYSKRHNVSDTGNTFPEVSRCP